MIITSNWLINYIMVSMGAKLCFVTQLTTRSFDLLKESKTIGNPACTKIHRSWPRWRGRR